MQARPARVRELATTRVVDFDAFYDRGGPFSLKKKSE